MAYAAEGVFSYGKPVARGPVPRAEAEIAAARARRNPVGAPVGRHVWCLSRHLVTMESAE